MKTIIRIIPAIALAISLSACGDNHSTTTSTSDTTTTNGSPMGNTATDNTGTGIQGGTEGGGAGSNGGGNMSTGAGANGTSGSANGSAGGSGSTTVLQGERTNANRGGTGSEHMSPNDSISNRSGLAPVR